MVAISPRLTQARPFTVLVIVVSALAAMGVGSLIRASATAEAQAEHGSHVNQIETFSGLAEITVASDAVIRGTILSVRDGRTLPGDAGPIMLVEVVVAVDEVLAGAVGLPTVVLEIDDAMFPDLRRSDPVWPVAGASTVLFLHQKLDIPGRYRPINSQGAYALVGTGLHPADGHDVFAASLARKSLEALKLEVKAARP